MQAKQQQAPEAEDRRVTQARLAERGIRLRLSTVGPNDPLPRRITVRGVPLSETVCRMRDDDQDPA